MIYEVLETWGQTMLIVIAVVAGPCDADAISNAPYRLENTSETHYTTYGFCRITYRARRDDVPTGLHDFNLWERNRHLRDKLHKEGVTTTQFSAPHFTTLAQITAPNVTTGDTQ